MILYLSRNENAHLLDKAANEKSLLIRKMTGSFNLSEFIALDMRRYASCRYFCVERRCATENDAGFSEALKSFKMMYSARVIVILENADEAFIRELEKIGVTDIVAAADADKKFAQIDDCLSDEGMRKPITKAVREMPVRDDVYRVVDYMEEADVELPFIDEKPKRTPAQRIVVKKAENEYYRFDCLNVKIGVIGATRRVGTTTVALGLAHFIRNHGGTACYVALNTNQHLSSIATAYNFDVEDDYYTFDTIDYYEGMLPKYDYNFIVSDFGEMKREAVRKFKESDIHLLCGASSKPFEIIELGEAYKQVRSVKPGVLIHAPPNNCNPLVGSAVTTQPTFIKPVGSMLDWTANEAQFKGFIKEYIVETSKKL